MSTTPEPADDLIGGGEPVAPLTWSDVQTWFAEHGSGTATPPAPPDL